jgi:TusA-related sulfurtransferase
MTIAKLELEQERCPVVIQKIMLAMKSFASNEDLSHLLVVTIESTAERDIVALLTRFPTIYISEIGFTENNERVILLSKITVR